MEMPDPQAVASGAAAAKTVIETLRGLFGLFNDTKQLLSKPEQEAAELIVDKSMKHLAIAEAQLAQALGYQLCKCEFPPTPMLTVGYSTRGGVPARGENGPVYECPKCQFNTALPYTFTRTRETK